MNTFLCSGCSGLLLVTLDESEMSLKFSHRLKLEVVLDSGQILNLYSSDDGQKMGIGESSISTVIVKSEKPDVSGIEDANFDCQEQSSANSTFSLHLDTTCIQSRGLGANANPSGRHVHENEDSCLLEEEMDKSDETFCPVVTQRIGNKSTSYCKYCKKTLTNFQDHTKIRIPPQECVKCGAHFQSRARFLVHAHFEHSKKGFGDLEEESWGPCPLCKKKVPKKTMLHHFRNSHTREGMYKCCLCGLVKKSISFLAEHYHKHHSEDTKKSVQDADTQEKKNSITELENAFSCEYCKKACSSFQDHTKMKIPPETCEICGVHFLSRAKYLIHMHFEHVDRNFNNLAEEIECPCPLCMKKVQKKNMLRHLQNSHTREGMYMCCMCGVIKKSSSYLIDHYHRHHSYPEITIFPEFSYKEKIDVIVKSPEAGPSQSAVKSCERNMTGFKKAKMHKKYASSGEIICKLCGEIFHWSEFLAHMKVPLPLETCSICNKSFKGRAVFLVHKQLHHEKEGTVDSSSGTKLVSCPICPEKHRPDKLHDHVTKVHTWEHYFKCCLCEVLVQSVDDFELHCGSHGFQINLKEFLLDQAARESNPVINHVFRRTDSSSDKKMTEEVAPNNALQDHGSIAPKLACELCGEIFNHFNFLAHMRVAMVPHTCFVCHKNFKARAKYLVHKQVNHGVEAKADSDSRTEFFSCPVCPKKYHRTRLYDHVKKMHTKENYFKCCVCGLLVQHREPFEQHCETHGCQISLKEFFSENLNGESTSKSPFRNTDKHKKLQKVTVKNEDSGTVIAENGKKDDSSASHDTASSLTFIGDRGSPEENKKSLQEEKHVDTDFYSLHYNHAVANLENNKESDLGGDSTAAVILDATSLKQLPKKSDTRISKYERLLMDYTKNRNASGEIHCKYCQMKLSSEDEFLQHVSLGNESKECLSCGRYFSSHAAYLVHEHSCSDINSDEKVSLNEDKGTSSKRKNSKQKTELVCPVCSKAFSCKRLLICHVKSHTKESRLKCCICGLVVTHYSVWKAHCDKHVEVHKKVRCFICSATFKTRGEFNAHRETHENHCYFCDMFFTDKHMKQLHLHSVHKDEMKKCEKCGKLFERETSLKLHVKMHRYGERQCPVCGGFFKALSKHLRNVHPSPDAEKYTCIVCAKTFSMKAKHTRHMQLHNHRRNYSCGLCGKTFQTTSTLAKHRKIHSGIRKHECPTCGKKCLMKSNLMIHMRVHSERKVFHCETCGKGFNYKASLQGHIRSKHC